MIIGIPREVKTEEFRVGMTPVGARELAKGGHTVLIESGAGDGSGFPDDDYRRAGAAVTDRNDVFRRAELVVKVKEPVSAEYALLRESSAIFTYLHLAPNPGLTRLLLEKRVTGLAYETLERDGRLPLLAPMSEIAGRMAPLMAAFYLQRFKGGSGVLPTGVSGVRPGTIVVLGAGVVGTNAARVGMGLGMETVVINKDTAGLQRIDELFKGRVRTLPMTVHALEEEIKNADILIGAVLVPGGRTPVLITREMLGMMKKGSVIVDVSVDQGGCVETSHPTTHDDPVYVVDGIVHYCVSNMPGAYPRTSTIALTNATLPYVKLL
ncbi:MAG TPA: alanine dehydrogenase, partial [Nitrospirota bacterium]